MNECCTTCRFFCKVRKSPTYQDVLTNVCAYFLVMDNEDYILEVEPNDMCECWTEQTLKSHENHG